MKGSGSDKSMEDLDRLGMEHIQQRRFVEALGIYQQLCRAKPRHHRPWFMLGALNGQLGDLQEALRCCRKAARLKPGDADAQYNLGQACRRLGRFEEAADCFRRVTRLRPVFGPAYENLGYTLKELGRKGEAVQCYRAALALDPDSSAIQYMLAVLGEADAPGCAPAEYVEGLFDGYAERFDTDLVQRLEYAVPQQLAGFITAHVNLSGPLRIADLGCGTGLMGREVRTLAEHLVGVDLSQGMLAEAADRGIYDALHRKDVLAWLVAAQDSYDMLLAADLFIYVGNLEGVFSSAARVLRSGGCFAFSVERDRDGDAYALRPSGRYAHARSYIERLATAAGLREGWAEQVVLRKEYGAPVEGVLYGFFKP